MTPINSQVVFITGGAHGIGAEVARRLHRRGAKLVLVDLDEVQLKALSTDLGGDRVLTVTADVRDLAAMEAAAAEAVQHFGGIDTVVANAGVASYGSVLGVSPEAFRRVIDVNLVGVFYTVRATLPAIIERRGYVLIVSSLAAFAAAPGMIPYDASKAGNEQLANSLRLEMVHQGVAVGSAHMSWVDTALVRDSKSDLASTRSMFAKLPWPLSKTAKVGDCADAFVKGIERRSSHVYFPRWVGLFRWLKPVVSIPAVEAQIAKDAATMLPQMDAEVAALGRSTSAYTVAIEKR